MKTNNIELSNRTKDMINAILTLREELDKEYADTPEREYISEAYDDAYDALSELTDSILKLGAYNLRMKLLS